ncbi:MAG: phytanoyl-CoA dioxygenase family protein [Legionellaceae bacterium]|nr:phytanoyl-CoA dioxygenase family protein [Legionellaceae bacterium]
MQKFSTQQLSTYGAEYHKKGYIVVRDFFNAEDMAHLTQWTSEVENWPIVGEKWFKYYELLDNQEKVLSRVENFVEYHQGFKQLVSDKKLLHLLTSLMGESVIFFKEKLNLKAPGAKGYTAHQDAPAFFDIDYDAISIFIAIDPATIENGCVSFVKNGEQFKEKLLPQNTHNHALSKEVVDTLHWEPIECSPGDVIIFSAYAPHYSTPNNTSDSRRAVFLTFGKTRNSISKTKVYYDKKRKIFPQDSERCPDVDYTSAASIYSFSSPVIVNVSSTKK